MSGQFVLRQVCQDSVDLFDLLDVLVDFCHAARLVFHCGNLLQISLPLYVKFLFNITDKFRQPTAPMFNSTKQAPEDRRLDGL
jgi:hypothetical protein